MCTVFCHVHVQLASYDPCAPSSLQARAPYSPVIIVGTHLDKLLPGEAPELRGRYRQLIEKIYMQPGGGYPEICDVIEVSAVTKEGWC